ncbi:PD-(D/E)XK nuclease family protein [Salegentibacter sp. LM13S]|uniref:PDDEXK-like family protein n=1 Tax=Salegentibacter lacus TaxID=2873599 RepID=UPI001CCE54A8|nr:PD-(D/E)XK nuclease family protein [Salegentibacter lacus]MBZ9632197.1 PD-(D/E)XK nuclease family protein [Salegentibacter lacus]
MDITKLETLLADSREIVNEHQKNIIEKGEDFNVFSILDLETSETKTHSKFLVALLDPKGNHYYKEKFLALFLEEIGYYKERNLSSARVETEYYLGKISKGYKSGGSIDILITFPSGKAIAIENKINAKDQKNQLYRYSQFKGGDCSLYYLNLFGKSPSKKSLHTLTNSDFEIISYNNQILKWLEKCLYITKDGSILQNAIKQYQILIKNLTNTMEKPLEDNLNNLIANNLEEAKYINAHYQKTVDGIREKFRFAVMDKLNSMPLVVKANLGNKIHYNHSQIWLSSDTLDRKGVKFGIESFSGKGHKNGRIFIGIFDVKNNYSPKRDGDYRLSAYWPIVSDINTPDNNPLNLSSTKILEGLSTDKIYFEKMLNELTKQTKAFIEAYYSEIT